MHEAICCGLPAIVSANAGVAERYPQNLQDLLLPSPDNADDLTLRLLNWRNHQETYAAATASFSQRLRYYTWNDMSHAIVSALDNTP